MLRQECDYESTASSFKIDFTKPEERSLFTVAPYTAYELRHAVIICRFNANCRDVKLVARRANGIAYASFSYRELYANGSVISNPSTPWVSVYDEANNVYVMMWTPAVPYDLYPGMSLSILVPKGDGTASIEYNIILRRVS